MRHPEIIYAFTMLIFLPMLVIQTRMLLYKRLSDRGYDRSIFDVLLEELPHDLAIIGTTLAFASYALVINTGAAKQTEALFILIPFVPFAFMSMIPIARSKHLRLTLGLTAYMAGAAVFLFGLFGDCLAAMGGLKYSSCF